MIVNFLLSMRNYVAFGYEPLPACVALILLVRLAEEKFRFD